MWCMCGDIYCKSCGPAQGNHYYSCCGTWAFDIEPDDAEPFDFNPPNQYGCYCTEQQLAAYTEAERAYVNFMVEQQPC